MTKNKGRQPFASYDPPSRKQPRSATIPSPLRVPTSQNFPSFNSETPSWRISKLEMANAFGWQDIERSKLEEIRAKLAQFESMTWNEILVGSKKQNHAVEVSALCKEAQERLVEIGLGDTATLISLRFSGKERVWGLRQGATLLVLWWDPEHGICPSLLKGT